MDPEAVSIASDIAIIASATVIATAAVFGIRMWRREMTGKARFRVAKSAMFLGLKLGGDFRSARNPFTLGGEFQGRSRQQNEVAAVSQVLDEWYARSHRLLPLTEDLQKFQEAHWEAQIVLGELAGKRVTKALDVYRKAYAELSSAISTYFEIRHDVASSGISYKDQSFLQELHKVIYARGDDDLVQKVDSATATLASALEGYIK